MFTPKNTHMDHGVDTFLGSLLSRNDYAKISNFIAPMLLNTIVVAFKADKNDIIAEKVIVSDNTTSFEFKLSSFLTLACSLQLLKLIQAP